MLTRPRTLLIAAACAALGGTAWASGYRETSDFADAVTAVRQCVDRHGPEATLLVVDIDNTLLAMRRPLGSDQWFEWQEYLLEYEPASPHLVADDFAGLLKAQGLLFTVGRMRPPQPDLPDHIRAVQALRVPTLVLTSRGDEFRIATERELESNGYDLASSVIETSGVPEGLYDPYQAGNAAAAGLTEAEAELFALGEPRKVSFANGVFMTAGQHKGAMLLTLLRYAETQPRAVVFVDDHGRHVHRVYDALARRGIESICFHYHREDDNVARFRYGEKEGVTRQWRRLAPAMAMAPPLITAPTASAPTVSEPSSSAPASSAPAAAP